MKLAGLAQVKQCWFDIPQRKLSVYHSREVEKITRALAELKLNERLEKTEENVKLPLAPNDVQQRITLQWVLAINLTFFVVELATGWFSRSMGLLADSLDMLADSIVYGLSLFAVGGALAQKKRWQKLAAIYKWAQLYWVL